MADDKDNLAKAVQRAAEMEGLAARYKEEAARANRRYDQLVADTTQLLSGLEVARDALVSAVNRSRKA